MSRADAAELPAWEYDILAAYAPGLAGIETSSNSDSPDPWAGVDSSRDETAIWDAD